MRDKCEAVSPHLLTFDEAIELLDMGELIARKTSH